MRKFFAIVLTAIILVCLVIPVSARIWSKQTISISCGPAPSMALLYGVQPVISNGTQVVHQTPMGWETYPGISGFIAGNAGNTIVGNTLPVYYGQDGKFYSFTSSPIRPVSLDGWVGPIWTFPSSGNPWFAVGADPNGNVYMAAHNFVAKVVGSGWSTPIELDSYGIENIDDMAISSFGDIAVGGQNDWSESYMPKNVLWYDYKNGTWNNRVLTTSAIPYKADIDWDSKGNLGAAYVELSPTSHYLLKFDYLDIKTSLWTSEILADSTNSSDFLSTALAFDRFDNPVVASGTSLFYDPIPTVPEPSGILALSMGMVLLPKLRKKF